MSRGGPRPIRIPDHALVILVGVSGSGKSTFARRHFAPEEVLSSDRFRALVSGDEADQSATTEAFRLLHEALDDRLAQGLPTVVDATSTQTWARRKLLDAARGAGRPIVTIVLDLPLETCLARNAGRTHRHVHPRAVRRQHHQLRASLRELADEGYDVLRVLREVPEVEAVTVVRDPA